MHTHYGRIDIAIEMKDKVIIIEFKLNQTAQAAIDQIKDKQYDQEYRDRNLTHLSSGHQL